MYQFVKFAQNAWSCTSTNVKTDHILFRAGTNQKNIEQVSEVTGIDLTLQTRFIR